MNIDEKKLDIVKNEIKEIFDNVYGRDTEKVFWYLVALHIMNTDAASGLFLCRLKVFFHFPHGFQQSLNFRIGNIVSHFL